MDQMTLTQKLISETTCPVCDASRMHFDLRCDLGLDECLYTATCLTCHTLFTVARPDEELTADGQGHTGDEAVAVQSYQCDPTTRKCHMVPRRAA